MRLVAGRLKSDYNYSNIIVYNNFVWPDATPEQRKLARHRAAPKRRLPLSATGPGSLRRRNPSYQSYKQATWQKTRYSTVLSRSPHMALTERMPKTKPRPMEPPGRCSGYSWP